MCIRDRQGAKRVDKVTLKKVRAIMQTVTSVSYTHLDVYKRQAMLVTPLSPLTVEAAEGLTGQVLNLSFDGSLEDVGGAQDVYKRQS